MITDDPIRGGKLSTFVNYLAHETELAYSSISNYVWGLRTWMKFQRQIDPAYGVIEWADFMAGIEVLTFVPAEPRKEVPGSWIVGSASKVDRTKFSEVQASPGVRKAHRGCGRALESHQEPGEGRGILIFLIFLIFKFF